MDMSASPEECDCAKGLFLDGISAAYGRREVLSGISLSVLPAEIVALVGPNGAGKSTVLRVAAGLVKPTRGLVQWAGTNINEWATHTRAQHGFAYFVQGGRAFLDLTVAENLQLALSTLPFNERPEGEAMAIDAWSRIYEFANTRAGLLSGGARHSLALAVAIARKPQLLLLDEPSAGLAPTLVQQTLNLIRKLAKVHGISILIVEQNVREALTHADRAYALAGGCLIGHSNHPSEWLATGEVEHLLLGKQT